MFFLYLVIISVLLIIALLVLFYVRTYDSISQMKEHNNQVLTRQAEMDKDLDKRIIKKTSKNEEKLNDQKKEMLKKLQNINDRIEDVDKELETKIKNVQNKIQNSETELENIDKKFTSNIDDIEERLPQNIVSKDEIISLLEELENDLGGEIDIIKDNQTNLEDKIDDMENDFVDWNNFKQETESALAPLQDNMNELKEQIDKNRIKIADYVVNYDKTSRKLKLRNENVDNNVDGVDILNANVGKTMNIANGGKLQFASVDDPYEITTGNENMQIKLPKSSSHLKMKIKDSTNSSHTFSGDGLATHEKGVKTPYIEIGNFIITEKDGELVVQDKENSDEKTLS